MVDSISLSEQEIIALKGRVFEKEKNVFVFDEVPVQTPPKMHIMFDELDRLRKAAADWYLIVDLRNTAPPDAEMRVLIRNKYLHMKNPPQKVFLVIGENFLMRLAARFVAGRALKTPYAVVKTTEEACDLLKRSAAVERQ